MLLEIGLSKRTLARETREHDEEVKLKKQMQEKLKKKHIIEKIKEDIDDRNIKKTRSESIESETDKQSRKQSKKRSQSERKPRKRSSSTKKKEKKKEKELKEKKEESTKEKASKSGEDALMDEFLALIQASESSISDMRQGLDNMEKKRGKKTKTKKQRKDKEKSSKKQKDRANSMDALESALLAQEKPSPVTAVTALKESTMKSKRSSLILSRGSTSEKGVISAKDMKEVKRSRHTSLMPGLSFSPADIRRSWRNSGLLGSSEQLISDARPHSSPNGNPEVTLRKNTY